MSKFAWGKNSTFGLGEIGYIPLGKKGKEEILGEFFPKKIPLALKYSTLWGNFVCGGKKFPQKIPLKKFLFLNRNGLISRDTFFYIEPQVQGELHTH